MSVYTTLKFSFGALNAYDIRTQKRFSALYSNPITYIHIAVHTLKRVELGNETLITSSFLYSEQNS